MGERVSRPIGGKRGVSVGMAEGSADPSSQDRHLIREDLVPKEAVKRPIGDDVRRYAEALGQVDLEASQVEQGRAPPRLDQ